jgi:predicted nucleotidyltransferase
MLELILRSKAEVKVLGVILFNDGLHIREIARRAQISNFEARREILIMQKVGLITLEKRGNQILTTINKNCPFFEEIKMLYLNTKVYFARIKQALTKIEKIEFAFVYGSMARADETQKSDLDLMIIGEPVESKLAKMIFEIQKTTNREINYSLWTKEQIKKNINGSFLSEIVKNKKVFLVGNEAEFARFTKTTSNNTN